MDIPESEQGDTEDAEVPLDLLELHEVLEWQEAVKKQEDEDDDG